jgi:hypothetical protein
MPSCLHRFRTGGKSIQDFQHQKNEQEEGTNLHTPSDSRTRKCENGYRHVLAVTAMQEQSLTSILHGIFLVLPVIMSEETLVACSNLVILPIGSSGKNNNSAVKRYFFMKTHI